jgi:bacterioferritin-associated ferredoxin
MKRMARQTGATSLDELQRHVEFGFNCQMCHPYVRLMLRTGQVEFEVLNEIPEE